MDADHLREAAEARLQEAAEAGDIERRYTLFQDYPRVLEDIDAKPFVVTPLHIAAAAGHIKFATEIIRLKPSFAWKLNLQGLSPIHLALQNDDDSMVLRFLSINKELVRVRGKKGFTPLHFAAETGKTGILAKFLSACPGSIQDLTIEGETALHIAVKYGRFDVLKLLVTWLWWRSYQLQRSILNWKNESGDTILHVSARMHNAQAVKFLMMNGIELNTTNLEDSTALDIVEMPQFANAEIKKMLISAQAKRGADVTAAPTLVGSESWKLKIVQMLLTITWKLKIPQIAPKLVTMARVAIGNMKIDEKTRGASLAVLVLMATMTYQSALSPPGGVYPADASANSSNNISSAQLNSTTSLNNSTLLQGKSVMSTDDFSLFQSVNTVCLSMSTMAICLLLPAGFISFPVLWALGNFWFGYLNAMNIISPTGDSLEAASYDYLTMTSTMILSCFIQASKFALQSLSIGRDRETESISEGNR